MTSPPTPQNPIISVIYEQARYDDLEAGIRSLALRNRSIPNINPSQLVLADRVQETTSSLGTGNIICNGPISQYQGFSVIGANNNTWYSLVSGDGVNWETGIGTINQLNPTGIARSTVFSSSNNGNLISLYGTSSAFCDLPAAGIAIARAAIAAKAPIEVQHTSAITSSSSSTNVSVTFGTLPKSGNTLLFILGSYGASGQQTITPAFTYGFNILNDQGSTVTNEQISVFIYSVDSSPVSSYTFNIASPNGYTSVYAAEISGARNFVTANQAPTLSASSLTGYVISPDNTLVYVTAEVNSGAAVVSVPSGLAQVAQTGNVVSGHSVAVFKASMPLSQLPQTVTFATTPNSYNLWNVTSVQS